MWTGSWIEVYISPIDRISLGEEGSGLRFGILFSNQEWWQTMTKVVDDDEGGERC